MFSTVCGSIICQGFHPSLAISPFILSTVWTINPHSYSLTSDFTWFLPLCTRSPLISFFLTSLTYIFSPDLTAFPSAGFLPRTQSCHLSRKMMILLSFLLDVELCGCSSNVNVSKKRIIRALWKKSLFLSHSTEVRYFYSYAHN